MKINSRHLALIAVLASSIAPATALAGTDAGATPSHHVATVCGKDYSRNSVTGDYCAPAKPSPYIAPVSAPSTPAPAAVPATTSNDSGFSWSNAGAGAGAIALIALALGGAFLLRRRSTASVN
ncbi:MAG TPA: hypothetical protein VGI67_02005 [Thermoleophilaceae bacterium]|jgi:hypothetical protein